MVHVDFCQERRVVWGLQIQRCRVELFFPSSLVGGFFQAMNLGRFSYSLPFLPKIGTHDCHSWHNGFCFMVLYAPLCVGQLSTFCSQCSRFGLLYGELQCTDGLLCTRIQISNLSSRIFMSYRGDLLVPLTQHVHVLIVEGCQLGERKHIDWVLGDLGPDAFVSS